MIWILISEKTLINESRPVSEFVFSATWRLWDSTLKRLGRRWTWTWKISTSARAPSSPPPAACCLRNVLSARHQLEFTYLLTTCKVTFQSEINHQFHYAVDSHSLAIFVPWGFQKTECFIPCPSRVKLVFAQFGWPKGQNQNRSDFPSVSADFNGIT